MTSPHEAGFSIALNRGQQATDNLVETLADSLLLGTKPTDLWLYVHDELISGLTKEQLRVSLTGMLVELALNRAVDLETNMEEDGTDELE